MGQSWYISINIYWHTGRLIDLHVHTCCCQPTVLLCWTLSSPYSFCGSYCRSSIKTPPPPLLFFFFTVQYRETHQDRPSREAAAQQVLSLNLQNVSANVNQLDRRSFILFVLLLINSSWALPIYTVNTPNRSIAHHWLDCLGDCSHSRGHGTAKRCLNSPVGPFLTQAPSSVSSEGINPESRRRGCPLRVTMKYWLAN